MAKLVYPHVRVRSEGALLRFTHKKIELGYSRTQRRTCHRISHRIFQGILSALSTTENGEDHSHRRMHPRKLVLSLSVHTTTFDFGILLSPSRVPEFPHTTIHTGPMLRIFAHLYDILML